jgi:double-stranded uracil-DNA glycosylase
MLSDLLTPNLKLVVCGTAAGNKSAELKQYYAKPGNMFWPTLFEVGLTPVLLKPSEYEKLLAYKIGLTDLVKHKSGMDTGLNALDFGQNLLRQNIEAYQPAYLCFNGKRAAAEFLLRKVEYGLLPEKIGSTQLFVAPSTSGAARGWWDIEVWRELAQLCNKGST